MINKKSTQKTNFNDSAFLLDPAEPQNSLEEQLISLYSDRKRLQDELGVSDPDGIIRMVRSMDEQLRALYAQLEIVPSSSG